MIEQGRLFSNIAIEESTRKRGYETFLVATRPIPSREDAWQVGVEVWGRGERCYRNALILILWQPGSSPPERMRGSGRGGLGAGRALCHNPTSVGVLICANLVIQSGDLLEIRKMINLYLKKVTIHQEQVEVGISWIYFLPKR